MSVAAESVEGVALAPVQVERPAGHAHHDHHGHHANHTEPPHRAGNASQKMSPLPARASLLMASAGLRLGVALGLIAVLWAAVAWALSGTP